MAEDYLTKCLELASNVQDFFDRPSASDWQRLEEELNLVFPESHKAFVCAFGSGFFGGFQIWNPASKGRFEFSKNSLIDAKNTFRALVAMKLSVFPEEGGLVFVANGNASNSFALKPNGRDLDPALIEVDLGGHLVTPTGMEIAEYLYRGWVEGIRGDIPRRECKYSPFFMPMPR